MGEIDQPWTTVLTGAQHDLILFGMVGAALLLLATVVRVRFGSGESHGTFRVASLTANSVVVLALITYVALIATFALGYDRRPDGTFHPTAVAKYAWELRYMDWAITVPLLVLEVAAISALSATASKWLQRIGMTAAIAMIASGFLGAFTINDGTDRTTYVALGIAGAVFFAALYALFVTTMRRTLPRLPETARKSYRSAIVVLLITWLIYPIVYGFAGAFTGGTVVVIGQLLFCAADLIAKVGFGTLVHRTSVLRSRNDEDLDPSTIRRPRIPQSDSVYVTDGRNIDFDH